MVVLVDMDVFSDWRRGNLGVVQELWSFYRDSTSCFMPVVECHDSKDLTSAKKMVVESNFIKRIYSLDVNFDCYKIRQFDTYEARLMMISPFVVHEIKIRKMSISSKSLKKIFKTGWVVEGICFDECVLDLKSLNFDISPAYKIKELSFESPKLVENYCEMIPIEGLGRLIEAISATSLKDSLRKIHMGGCEIDFSTMRELTIQYGLDQVLCSWSC
ncbi:unnamed protein product [Moneuplotes crassus]|uniref:Uncharacterized protein n=1 Tax=Euplotes crassus TaxID=5936 RepID=A0AAD2D1H6_EUPCR|nr:unnamed protein product [Moneuplotes crassus]